MIDDNIFEEEGRYNYFAPPPVVVTEPPPDSVGPIDPNVALPPHSTTNPTYQDLAWWRAQGVNPDQIFDENGQLRPGWSRTARGYERAATGGGGGGGGGGGAGGGGFGYLTEPFTKAPPGWQMGPTFTAPQWTPPPAFSYKDFVAPTEQSMYADPSYQFRFGQGQKALEQSAAGRGVLRTGGTLKDLTNYGQNAASQEYSNIFKRAVDTHNLGLEQALGTYGVNYGVSKDQRDYLFDAARAEFSPKQRENELMNERNFANFLAEFDIFEKNRRRAGDYLTWAADQGRA